MKLLAAILLILSSGSVFSSYKKESLTNSDLRRLAQAATSRVSSAGESDVIHVSNHQISQILQNSIHGATDESAEIYIKKISMIKEGRILICSARFTVFKGIQNADVSIYACRDRASRRYVNWDLAEFNIHLDELL